MATDVSRMEAAPKDRVLLIGDAVHLKLAAREFLESSRLDVTEAESAGAAEKALATFEPDLVIVGKTPLDASAPDALSRLRAIDPEVPIMLLIDREALESAELEDLLALIERLCAARRERARQRETEPSVAGVTLAEIEKRHILRVLEDQGGHVARAARKLGVPRSSLYQRLKNYGIALSGRLGVLGD
jgi:DNA-binding NtrC family response regulator